MKPPPVEMNVLDRVISAVAPVWGAQRYRARALIALAGGYKGARRDRRPTAGWRTRTESADAAILPDLPTLRERSRDLARNTPLAGGAINTTVTNVVGTGLHVQPQVDREFLGLTEVEAENWERDAERIFTLWAGSGECDLTRTQTFVEMQDLAFRSVLESGDHFVVNRFVERPGGPFGYKLQMVEGDRVSNPKWTRDTPTIAGGVEVDGNGAPIAYHMTDKHPGDLARGARALEWTRVPAFGSRSGRRNVIHLLKRLRAGQTRGVPYLAPVIEALKELSDYTDAELQGTVIAAMFSIFVKTPTGQGMAPVTPTEETGASAADKDTKLAPAAIIDLAAGEEVEIANPGRPNVAFDPFVQAVLRQIGVQLELPFEILIKHFTASYSAARAALLEAWKFFRARRAWLASRLCQPAYENVLAEAIARGWLSAPGFFSDPFVRQAYCGALWVGPAAGQIDPKKENEADAIAEDRGWKTASQNTAEKTGGSWRRNHEQRAKEERLRREAGLAGGKASAPPAPAPAPDDAGDGGAEDKPEDETEDVA